MDRRTALKIITTIVKDKPTAEMVLERLEEEGVLHLGYGNADVDAIVNKFSETFGTTKVTRYDRYAAKRLAQKYGAQSITGIIQLLGENRQEKYAPVVGSVLQLEDKLVNVINFLRKINNNPDINV